MSDHEPTTCRHCGKRIVWVNWSGCPGWTHQHAGAAFQDGMHEFCKVTCAEPALADQGSER